MSDVTDNCNNSDGCVDVVAEIMIINSYSIYFKTKQLLLLDSGLICEDKQIKFILYTLLKQMSKQIKLHQISGRRSVSIFSILKCFLLDFKVNLILNSLHIYFFMPFRDTRIFMLLYIRCVASLYLKRPGLCIKFCTQK